MKRVFTMLALLIICCAPQLLAQQTASPGSKPLSRMRSTTQKQRKAAASRAAQKRLSVRGAKSATAAAPRQIQTIRTNSAIVLQPGCATPVMNPGGTPDYMSGCVGNYANSPLPTDVTTGAGGLRKFVDPLPSIPVAVPDKHTYPGSDYYEISLIEYSQQMHSDLPNKTLLRGYVQTNNGMDENGANVVAPAPVQYLGPLIVAQKNRPVRIKFTNNLPVGQGGDLSIPVDTSVMGSGMGPGGGTYTQNRSGIHLHGGNTPWISDGTPHQWTVPANENTPYPKGVGVQDVPDMPATGAGEMTFYYTNQQSARLMFYHDHAYGITRLNVYAGVAAGYLLTDDTEGTLVNGGTITYNGVSYPVSAGTIPVDQIPLVIQDKTFVPAPDQLAAQDPTWGWGPKDVNGNFVEGNLWFPHVYMPNQNPSDLSGANAMGRWDWGPWFWPPMDPSTLVAGEQPCPNAANPDQMCPGTPNPSLTPEAFMDTSVVNGMAYPYVNVDAKPYRLRILNAANDRGYNLGLYCADPTVTSVDGRSNTEVKMLPAVATAGWPAVWPTDGRDGGVPDPATAGPPMIQIGTEGGFLPAPVVIPSTPVGYNYNRRDIVVLNVATHGLFLGPAERADVIVDFSQAPAGCTNLILYNDAPAPTPAFDPRYDYYTGDPDQTDTGGAPSTLAGFGPNTRTIMQFRLNQAGSGSAATNLVGDCASLPICSKLAAVMPAAFAVAQDAPIIPESVYNTAYGTTYKNTYSRIQDTSLFTGSVTGVMVMNGGSGYLVPPTVKITSGGGSGATAVAVLTNGTVSAINVINGGTGYNATPTITITPAVGDPGKGASAIAIGQPITRKAIQELFELDYGRMNATLGIELPFTNFNTQTTIPLGYVDPATEIMSDGETQVWKITHNGVDTHAIHFHLFNVQLINRVGWDGAIRPPEANEIGWKETVRMNPLEDAIVAIRPLKQSLPWKIPDSNRPLDVTKAVGDAVTVTNPVDGNRTTVTNDVTNFGWEYVWHCHLLGHEENDMMRPIVFYTAQGGLSPVPLDFGSVLTESSTVLPVTFSNSGHLPITINSIGISGTNANLFSQTNNCPPVVASGQVCVISVNFQPGGNMGARNALLTVSTSAGPFTDTITGVAAAATTTIISAPAINYLQNGSVTVNVLSNAGFVLGTVSLAVDGGAPTSLTLVNGMATFDGSNTPALATPLGGTHTLSATYAAQAFFMGSSATGTLVVNRINPTITWANPAAMNAGASLSATQLNATANAPGTFVYTPPAGTQMKTPGTFTLSTTFTPTDRASYNVVSKSVSVVVNPYLWLSRTTPVNFGSINVGSSSTSATTTVTNYTLTPVAISVSVPAGFVVTSNNCTGSRPVGSTCTIGVAFRPTVGGLQSGNVNISGNGVTASFAVSGTGIVPGVVLTRTSIIHFGTINVGSTSTAANNTVSNQTGAATTISISVPAGYVITANNCTGTRAANSNCSFSVAFKPTAVGFDAGNVVVTSGNGYTASWPVDGTGR